MRPYHYRCRTATNRLEEGVTVAESAVALATRLEQQQKLPISIEEVAGAERPEGGGWLQALESRFPVKEQDLALFCRQLYAMLHAGVPIHVALRDVVQAYRHPGMVVALRQLRLQVEQGYRFSTALARFPRIFPGLMVQMVRTGEETGKMDQVFLYLAEHIERESGFRDRMGDALRYPILMILLLGVALMVVSIWVIPAFAEMLGNAGGTLPLATRVLMGGSQWLQQYGLYGVALMVMAVVAVLWHRRSESGQVFWDRWILSIPIYGVLSRTGVLSQFARTLALVTRAGVPLSRGLGLVAGTLDNHYYQQQVERFRERLDEGIPFSRIVEESALFTPMVVQIFRVGEQTGQVDRLLEHVSAVYEREATHTMNNINSLIQPVMLLLISGVVLLMGLGVILPYLEMSRSVAL